MLVKIFYKTSKGTVTVETDISEKEFGLTKLATEEMLLEEIQELASDDYMGTVDQVMSGVWPEDYCTVTKVEPEPTA